jgi:hypothetical protein
MIEDADTALVENSKAIVQTTRAMIEASKRDTREFNDAIEKSHDLIDSSAATPSEMTKEQALRIQHEILPGSDCLPNGEPFLMYGVWAFPFTHAGAELPVYLIPQIRIHRVQRRTRSSQLAAECRPP